VQLSTAQAIGGVVTCTLAGVDVVAVTAGEVLRWLPALIDQEHRLVSTMDGDQLVVLQARHHY
jgi:hypothetical protein